jgi:glyoxylase-like metal-dependent hydrolase (beta-lactamase superfamily II)
VRALAVDADVIVVVSAVWQTTCTLVRAGDEGFVIDSPILPDELTALPSIAEQAGFPVSGLLATHGDWDHVLGRLAFPEASLGVCETTFDRLGASLGEPQRKLRNFDDEWYVERAAPLQLGGIQSLPVPGRLSVGEQEIELHVTAGHTADGCAFWLPWLSVLVVGDYLSPAEHPSYTDRKAYIETLERLAPLVSAASTIIPGHGHPLTAAEATQILNDDLARLRAASEDSDLQLARRKPSLAVIPPT